jgi:hypothetical protein
LFCSITIRKYLCDRLKADLHIPWRSHAVSMPFPCLDPATTLPRPCHFPAISRQCRTHAGRPHVVSGRPILIHTYHAVPCGSPAVALRGRFQKGIFVAWQGNGMACVNPTRPHCVNQMGKAQSKPLAKRHGRGMAWERHGNGMVCVNPP